MKKGINYWSFGADLGSDNPPYDKAFALAKKLGFDSVEVSVSASPGSVLKFNSKSPTIKKVKDAAAAAGIEISSVASGDYWGISLVDSNKRKREKAVQMVKNQLRIAAELGVGYILVVPGAVQPQFLPDAPHIPYKECWKLASQGIRQCVKTAEKYTVAIGIENVWNKFLLSPLEMLGFCKQFGSSYVKCYLDVGNAMFNGFPQDWIRILGKKYIAGIHVKDFRTHFFLGGEKGKMAKVRDACKTIAKGSGWAGAYAFCDIGAGDLPVKEVVKALKEIGYNGNLTAEMLPPYKGILAKTAKAMDKILAVAAEVKPKRKAPRRKPAAKK